MSRKTNKAEAAPAQVAQRTPLQFWMAGDGPSFGIGPDPKHPIARTIGPEEEENQKHARALTHAHNCHDELLAALKECITSDGAACLNEGTSKQREIAMFRRLEAINQAARAALANAERGNK